MNNTFFTSDTHFGHSKNIEYSERPFKTIEEHDEALISNWNKVVGKGDKIYHLGDFCFYRNVKDIEKLIRRLNGQIHFVEGNHDYKMKQVYSMFQSVSQIKEIKVKVPNQTHPQKIVLCHYPMESWNCRHYGAYQLHGHCHGTLNSPSSRYQKRLDVGVDCWNYTPVSFQQIKEVMDKINYEQIDAH